MMDYDEKYFEIMVMINYLDESEEQVPVQTHVGKSQIALPNISLPIFQGSSQE
ncbi:hypothetical protein PR048_018143 [Dryococelus australis]|uniref:Uncharacterized protein n=1 Tax=Dryococelus australis TaxID=614101 RepID=A0ABQ9HBF6_9NEOP|nr:hypothetical protein PR048_018143 [Dryococelus australis]